MKAAPVAYDSLAAWAAVPVYCPRNESKRNIGFVGGGRRAGIALDLKQIGVRLGQHGTTVAFSAGIVVKTLDAPDAPAEGELVHFDRNAPASGRTRTQCACSTPVTQGTFTQNPAGMPVEGPSVLLAPKSRYLLLLRKSERTVPP